MSKTNLETATHILPFYIKDTDIIKEVVKPIIDKIKKDFNVEVLQKLLLENTSKVLTALFNQTQDSKQIHKFIESLYDQLDNENEKQVETYNSLYDLANEALISPKMADGRWVDDDQSAHNRQYAHLFAIFASQVEAEGLKILGEHSDQ